MGLGTRCARSASSGLVTSSTKNRSRDKALKPPVCASLTTALRACGLSAAMQLARM